MIRNFMQLMIANEEKEKNLAQGLADKPSGSMRNWSKQKSSGSMRNLRKQKSTKSMEGDTCPNDASITKDAPSEAAAPSEEKQKRQIRHVAHGVAHRDKSMRSVQNDQGSGAQSGQRASHELTNDLEDRSSDFAGRAPDFAGMFTIKKLAAVRKEGRASILPKRSSLLPSGSTAGVQLSSQEDSAPRARFISSAKNPTRVVRRTISKRWNRGLNSHLRLLGWTSEDGRSLADGGNTPPVEQVLDFLQRKYRGVDDADDPSATDPSPEEIKKLETWATSTLGQPVGSCLDDDDLVDLVEIVSDVRKKSRANQGQQGQGKESEEQTKAAFNMRENVKFRKQKILADRQRHEDMKQQKQQDSVERALLGGGTYTELFSWLQAHRKDKDLGEAMCAFLDPVMARVVANGQFRSLIKLTACKTDSAMERSAAFIVEVHDRVDVVHWNGAAVRCGLFVVGQRYS
jgi:hypothetical protein